MGREIVYCWKCAKRIDGADFEQLKAYRYGDKVSCDECVYDLVGDLPAEEQEAILSGGGQKKSTAKMRPPSDTARRAGPPTRTGATTRTTAAARTGKTPITRSTGKVPVADGGAPRRGTRSIPKVEAPVDEEAGGGPDADAAAKKKKLILIGAGGGGLLLVVVVVLMLLLGGKKSKPPAAATAPESETVKTPKPAEVKPSREAEAKKAYDAAMAVFKDKPGELSAQMKALRDAELAAAGTPVEEAVKTQLEVLGLEVDKQLKALDAEIAPFLPENKFKDALALLGAALVKHDFPEWTKAVEKKTEQTKAILEDRFLNEKKRALEAKDNGDTAKVNDIVAKVTAWEQPELLEKLKKELGAVDAPPDAPPSTPDATAKTPAKKPKREAKPLSKEMQSYMSSWERAAGFAFQRDFDGAMAELRRAVKEIDADEVRKESGVDLELLEQAKAWVEEAVGLQTKAKRLENVALEIHDKPGELATVSGKITKIFDQRFEIRVTADKDGKKVTTSVLVEYADLSGRSLAEQVKKLRAPAKNDGRIAGLLCLLEGNEEAAQALGGKDAEALPDRYWLHAPNAKEKAPKSNGKEFEARNLFHKAEIEYKDIQTWGPAFDKYKTLLNEYSTTRIVRRNQKAIVKRGEVAKEHHLNARDFKTEGQFRPAKKPDLVLQATKDVDIQEMRDNYVEAEFYAVPGVQYRCWAYVGACCKETFSFYLQTSDRTTSHQGKQLAIDPGANMAEQVKHQISGLKNDHAAHAPRDKKLPHPKDATRWEWVPVPLAKTYPTAGAKSVRLLTDQAGFAVKFIVISSLRTKTPDEKDMAELLKALNEPPVSDDTGVKGSPEPKEWLIAGPFNEPLNTRQPPEAGIDLAKEMTGKGNKKFKWKLVTAAPQDGYVMFNWEDGKVISPKDNVSTYVLIHVKTSTPMTVQLAVGHDDGGKIWVNDESVHFVDKGGGKDAYKPKAVLEEGWNRILIKVRNGNGGYNLHFRILDEAGQPIPGLAYSAYGDELVPP